MKSLNLKRIISILLSLALIFGATVSFSACRFIITTPDTGDTGDGGDEIPEKNPDKTDDGEDESTDTDDGVEFLPKDEDALDNLSSAQSALLSVVRVVSSFEVYTGFGTSTSTIDKEGSGVIYKLDRDSGDAYILTNYHVVYQANSLNSTKLSKDISLYLYGQESEAYKIDAVCLGGSLSYDLAVLRVTGSEVLKNSYAKEAPLGDSDALTPLDPVVAIGNPERNGISVTEGIVSVDSEDLVMLGADDHTAVTLRVIRVSAAINEGNSGGGLFDSHGNLIGIVVAKKTGADIDNMGYALPINSVRGTADAIIHYCDGETNTSLYKCIVGFTPAADVKGLVIDKESGKIFKAERVIVKSLTSDSLLTGEIGVGDVINSITVDGVTKEVTRVYHVLDHMMTARVGSTVTFSVTRDGITFNTTPLVLPESSKTQIK